MTCLSFADLYALDRPGVRPASTSGRTARRIATELGSTTTLPDADLLVITGPGEESGHVRQLRRARPRPTLAEERGSPRKITTRPDYTASANDNAIIEGIAGSPTARSAGSASPSPRRTCDTVKALEVAEEPDGDVRRADAPRRIADNSYPISRDLYIYVNKAKAAENPAVAAYVDYYLADGTISTVLETVAVREPRRRRRSPRRGRPGTAR